MTTRPANLANLAIVGLVCGRFWLLSGPYPPGLDGAQWLALGRGFTVAGRSAAGVYPPLVPALTAALAALLGPVSAVRVAGIVILALLGCAIWALSAVLVGPGWSVLAVALALPATANAEPFFYGGYPQQAAFAFGMLGVWLTVRATHASDVIAAKRLLALSGGCFLLSALCHVLYAPLMIASGALTAVLMIACSSADGCRAGLWRRDEVATRSRTILVITGLALLPALAAWGAIAFQFWQLGYGAPLDATGRAVTDAWGYATREAPVAWAALLACGVFGGIVSIRRRRLGAANRICLTALAAWAAGAALALPAGALFALSGQPRLAPPLLLGGCIMVIAGPLMSRHGEPRIHIASGIALSALALWLGWQSTRVAVEYASFYRVLDTSTVNAAAFLASEHSHSALAVMADKRGWPVGWWYEALQQRPVYTGSDARWLAFPDERARAEAVRALFASPDSRRLRELATNLGVDTLVVRKWEWIGWDRWLSDPGSAPTVLFDDGETLVLSLAGAGD